MLGAHGVLGTTDLRENVATVVCVNGNAVSLTKLDHLLVRGINCPHPNESYAPRIPFPLLYPRRHLLPRLHRAVGLLAASGLDPHLATRRIMACPRGLAQLQHCNHRRAALRHSLRAHRSAPAYVGNSVPQPIRRSGSCHARRRRHRSGPLPLRSQSPLPRQPIPHLRTRASHAAHRSDLLHSRGQPLPTPPHRGRGILPQHKTRRTLPLLLRQSPPPHSRPHTPSPRLSHPNPMAHRLSRRNL